MSEILLFTGGARSGKSAMAENAVKEAAIAAACRRGESANAERGESASDGHDEPINAERGEAGKFAGDNHNKSASDGNVLYIATAAVCDEEMEERVKKHRAQRPAHWATLEAFWNFDTLEERPEFQKADAVLLDCMGFMLNNIMYYLNIDWENLPLADMQRVEDRMIAELRALMGACRRCDKTLALVTNEVGMGLVPADRSSRYYRDILGRANRTAAEEADRVCFMVSGIPLWVK